MAIIGTVESSANPIVKPKKVVSGFSFLHKSHKIRNICEKRKHDCAKRPKIYTVTLESRSKLYLGMNPTRTANSAKAVAVRPGASKGKDPMRNLVLDIPRNVSVEILKLWVPLRSITDLDQAHCQRSTRRVFLELLSDVQFSIEKAHWLYGKKARVFAKWVLSRQVRIQSVALGSSPAPSDAIRFFQHIGKGVKSIQLDVAPTTVALAGAMCSQLESAEILGCRESQALGIFLHSVQGQIQTLSFRECSGNVNKMLHEVRFPALKALKVDGSFTAPWVQHVLDNSPSLDRLAVREVSHWGASADSMSTLPPQLPNLKCLMLENTRNIPATVYTTAFPTALNLQVLSLVKLPAITDAIIQTVVTSCPLLHALCLDSCVAVTDVTLQYIAIHINARLTHLDVSSCKQMTPLSLKDVADMCENLTDLSIRSMGWSVLGEQFAEILRCVPGLQSLDVSGNSLGPACIRALAKDLPRLTYLGLRDVTCPSRKPGIDYIARHAPRLTTVSVRCGNGMFTDLACNLWEACCPGVKLVTEQTKTPFWAARDFAAAGQKRSGSSEDDSSDDGGEEASDSSESEDEEEQWEGFDEDGDVDGSEQGDY